MAATTSAMTALAPPFAECGVRIEDDAIKGKIVRATRAFAAGDVIFSEQAFVFAPWSTDVCPGCEERKSDSAAGTQCACDRTNSSDAVSTSPPALPLYPKALATNLARREQVVRAMADLDGIAEVDRARCVLRCLAMVERDASALDDVLQLTSANYEQSLEAATAVRALAPDAIPSGVSDATLATLIGVLNTNSHELENLGGSGLFLSACRMEHSCCANCSFTTFDAQLWMTAITPIAMGDALSIDYGNFFYRPTEERMSSLLESYGFLCTCDACRVSPDVTRSFQCQASGCKDGVVWPTPKPTTAAEPLVAPEDLEFTWPCSSCHAVATPQNVAAFVAVEQQLLTTGFPETLEDVDALVAAGLFHRHHYLLFWALDAIGCEAAALSAFVGDDAEHQQRLTATWERLIASMNVVVPTAHHEKTIYYDNLAQVRVVLGDVTGAKAAYKAAYDVACVVSGTNCVPTQKLRQLVEHTPETAAELRAIYDADAKPQRPEDEYEDESDEDDDLDPIDEDDEE